MVLNFKVRCDTLEDFYIETEKLDKAKLCPFMIDDGGVLKEIKTHKAIYNISRGLYCATVTDGYALVQHADYFNRFAEALSRLGLNYSITPVQAGNKAIADIDFINKNIKFDKLGEEFTTGIRVVNSYNKTTGMQILPRFTRLACTNGMVLTSLGKSILSITHYHKNVKELDSLIEKKLSSIFNSDAKLQTLVSDSMKDSIEWKLCVKIISKLFLSKKHSYEILDKLGIVAFEVEDKTTKKKRIEFKITDEMSNKKINRWDVYNAVTSFLTHKQHLSPSLEHFYQSHAEKILTTSSKELPMIEVLTQ